MYIRIIMSIQAKKGLVTIQKEKKMTKLTRYILAGTLIAAMTIGACSSPSGGPNDGPPPNGDGVETPWGTIKVASPNECQGPNVCVQTTGLKYY